MQNQPQTQQNRVYIPVEFPFSKPRTIIDMCPICLEPEAVISLFGGCRHGVCEDCRVKLRSNLCPICRAEIPKSGRSTSTTTDTQSTATMRPRNDDEERRHHLYRLYVRRQQQQQQQQYTREEIEQIAIQAVVRILAGERK